MNRTTPTLKPTRDRRRTRRGRIARRDAWIWSQHRAGDTPQQIARKLERGPYRDIAVWYGAVAEIIDEQIALEPARRLERDRFIMRRHRRGDSADAIAARLRGPLAVGPGRVREIIRRDQAA